MVIPKKAVTHIQNIAAGPPRKIARATPPILPVPTVPDNAVVKATTDWGIFLDINGIDALLHVSDLSHGRVKKPSDLVTIGQTLKVKLTKIDKKTNRISASVKALTEDPYENIDKKYKVGEVYEGTVTKIMDYGCFVKIEDGIEGLIHSSELDWANRNIKPSKVLSISQ